MSTWLIIVYLGNLSASNINDCLEPLWNGLHQLLAQLLVLVNLSPHLGDDTLELGLGLGLLLLDSLLHDGPHILNKFYWAYIYAPTYMYYTSWSTYYCVYSCILTWLLECNISVVGAIQRDFIIMYALSMSLIRYWGYLLYMHMHWDSALFWLHLSSSIHLWVAMRLYNENHKYYVHAVFDIESALVDPLICWDSTHIWERFSKVFNNSNVLHIIMF